MNKILHPKSPSARMKGCPQDEYPPQQEQFCQTNCIADESRLQGESRSLSAANYIYISGGMSFAWTFNAAQVYSDLNISESVLTHLRIGWFLAAILGAFLATISMKKLTRRTFYILACVLVLINGFLLISEPNNLEYVTIARYCDGTAFGLTSISTIVDGSEQIAKKFRGEFLAMGQFSIPFGMFMNRALLDAPDMQGLLVILAGFFALFHTMFYTIESPVFYLHKGNEKKAIKIQYLLQRPKVVPGRTYKLLNENKRLLAEDVARGHIVNIRVGLIPMVKLCLFRALVSLTLSLPLVWSIDPVSIFTNDEVVSLKNYLSVYDVLRMAGTFVSLLTLDTLGRKEVTVFSLLIGGVVMIGLGTVFSNCWYLTYSGTMVKYKALLSIYYIVTGLAAPASTCYLGEAFSISVKPYFILVTVIFESIIQISICYAYSDSMGSLPQLGYIHAFAALHIAFAILLHVGMPETKNTTLREALARFTMN